MSLVQIVPHRKQLDTGISWAVLTPYYEKVVKSSPLKTLYLFICKMGVRMYLHPVRNYCALHELHKYLLLFSSVTITVIHAY